MKKPEKYEPVECESDHVWNCAIDEYEKYHNWKMEQLPDEEEISKIVDKYFRNVDIAKAIAKRIGK